MSGTIQCSKFIAFAAVQAAPGASEPVSYNLTLVAQGEALTAFITECGLSQCEAFYIAFIPVTELFTVWGLFTIRGHVTVRGH